MKALIIRTLLSILNSRWLNPSPCKYGFIGNIDAFSFENLESEDRQRPGITVRTVLDEAIRFKSCPINENIVIEGDDVRPMEWGDVLQLRNSLRGERKNG